MNDDEDGGRLSPAERRQLLDESENSVELNLGETTPSANITENQNSDKRNQNGSILTEVFFTHLDIEDNLELLPNGASPGPDGVPTSILKHGKVPISRILCNIMKSSMDTGVIPQILKSAFITPVHKGGSMAEPSHFRPISLTSHVCKTFERVQRRGIVNFLEYFNKMDPNQHGSRANRSTLSQLLEHQEEIIKILEEGDNVDSIYLDFLKAFDKCDHGILMHKIKKLGIKGKLGVWLCSFLTNRTQTVMINGVKSESSILISGVPQGSVLGPILFLIYIADLGDNIEALVKIYVDDSKIKDRIKTKEDVENLQINLEKMYEWEKSNNMKFNGNKFQILRYGRNQELKEETMYFTPEMEETIEPFNTLRDLGVIMNDQANFNDHIEHVAKKVRQKIGWVLRTFSCRRNEFMKNIFNSLVQPHIDYCSQLWMPNTTGEMEKIEKLLKDFTAKIPWLREDSYWTRLKILKMNSEQRRLERYRIIYTWKILEGLVPNCGIETVNIFDPNETESDRRGRRCIVPKIKTFAVAQRQQSFQVGGPKLFNSLPANIRNMTKCTVDEFKMKLDQFLTKLPDEPKIGGLVPGACDQLTSTPSNSIPDQIRRVGLDSWK